jgi:hypothetical protein
VSQELLVIIFAVIQLALAGFIFYFSAKILFICYTMVFWNKPWRTPYVPARKWVIKKAFRMLKIREGDEVVDLGSGDGQFVIYGAHQKKANFTGIELNWLLICISWLKALFTYRVGRVKFIKSNFFNVPLSKYNKVYMFSLETQIRFMLPKFVKEMKPGTLVLSVMFPVKSKAFRLLEKSGTKRYELYLYEKVNGKE